MKVIDGRKKEETKGFKEIKIGECFRDRTSDAVYMKTNDVDEYYEAGWYEYEWHTIANAVCLGTGYTHKFNGGQLVIPLTCECVIKDN